MLRCDLNKKQTQKIQEKGICCKQALNLGLSFLAAKIKT